MAAFDDAAAETKDNVNNSQIIPYNTCHSRTHLNSSDSAPAVRSTFELDCGI